VKPSALNTQSSAKKDKKLAIDAGDSSNSGVGGSNQSENTSCLKRNITLPQRFKN
jgi:hypothetical protein